MDNVLCYVTMFNPNFLKAFIKYILLGIGKQNNLFYDIISTLLK